MQNLYRLFIAKKTNDKVRSRKVARFSQNLHRSAILAKVSFSVSPANRQNQVESQQNNIRATSLDVIVNVPGCYY